MFTFEILHGRRSFVNYGNTDSPKSIPSYFLFELVYEHEIILIKEVKAFYNVTFWNASVHAEILKMNVTVASKHCKAMTHLGLIFFSFPWAFLEDWRLKRRPFISSYIWPCWSKSWWDWYYTPIKSFPERTKQLAQKEPIKKRLEALTTR